MIYIIYPIDPTTEFLADIIRVLKDFSQIKLIKVEPSDASYKSSLISIEGIQKGSNILFMGHGTDDELLGGECEEYKRRVFVRKGKMGVFRGQNLILLSCNSNGLVKGSQRTAGFASALSFGVLPTDMQEVEKNSKLKKWDIMQSTLEKYKRFIVEAVSQAILCSQQSEQSLEVVHNHLRLLINKEISNQVLNQKDIVMANLLFQMKHEMKCF